MVARMKLPSWSSLWKSATDAVHEPMLFHGLTHEPFKGHLGFGPDTDLASIDFLSRCARLCQLSYKRPAEMGGYLEASRTDLVVEHITHLQFSQVLLLRQGKDGVLVFRGTIPLSSDWEANLNFSLRPAAQLHGACQGSVHGGFLAAFIGIRDQLQPWLDRQAGSVERIWLLGHSLGGALATLAASWLLHSRGIRAQQVISFGQPMVGDATFADKYDQTDGLGSQHLRLVNGRDFVTDPLFATGGIGRPVGRLRHVGKLQQIGKKGWYLDRATAFANHSLSNAPKLPHGYIQALAEYPTNA
jgi:triacylglycerol lipase